MNEKFVFSNGELDKHLRKITIPSSSTLNELKNMILQGIIGRGWPVLPERAVIRSTADCCNALPKDHMSIRTAITKDIALAFQQKTGAEISYDCIQDIKRERWFSVLTRGSPGMAGSDHLLFFMCSSSYFVRPVFHTHPEYENELGRYKPSISDYKAIYLLKKLQKADDLFDMVVFPDGKVIKYGFGYDGWPMLDVSGASITDI